MCYSIQGICKGTNLLECAIVYKVFVKGQNLLECAIVYKVFVKGQIY